MIKYFVEYNQNDKLYNNIELYKRNNKEWYGSYKYLGSSTRAYSPEVYLHEDNIIIYKSFEFTLKKVIDDFSEVIMYNKIVTSEYIEKQINSIRDDSLQFNPILYSIQIDMKEIGTINFGIRDLHRWPGNPGEIYNCIFKLN